MIITFAAKIAFAFENGNLSTRNHAKYVYLPTRAFLQGFFAAEFFLSSSFL